ncbi:hypothetical protein BMS3Bbin06_00306 [bacterium BMS3Bbin06]|nr:hypothetical protein BMS3Abin08_00889 [bacterium BMS3Abin08]GBE33791.1 hypothetical protein BMS3Bbin06_00306 [bacterium BMS3Bbin06]
MLTVPLAIVADNANISREGKLNVLGVFEHINAQKVPTAHPFMSLVFVIEGERAEAEREHELKIQLVDADGKVIVNVEGGFKFGLPMSGQLRIKANHIINLVNVNFPDYGTYEFNIIINKEVRKQIPITIVKPQLIPK